MRAFWSKYKYYVEGGCLAIVLLAVIIAYRPKDVIVPEKLETSEHPTFELAARNASFLFLEWTKRDGNYEVKDEKAAFGYLYKEFERLAEQKVFAPETFTQWFCNPDFVARENGLIDMKRRQQELDASYVPLRGKLGFICMNKCFNWLKLGYMVRRPADDVMLADAPTAFERCDSSREDVALRNIALECLRMAQRAGFSFAEGKVMFADWQSYMKEAVQDTSVMKATDLTMLKKAYCSAEVLDFLEAEIAIERLLKRQPQGLDTPEMKTCMQEVSQQFSRMEAELVKLGHVAILQRAEVPPQEQQPVGKN